ncbi:hypothetical protein [Cryobacterium sp. PAMC25264]|nr:hypothetical protein [Cryobacterium sp. PAMC25264]
MSARAAATIGSLILVVPSIVLILTVIGSMDDAWVLMVQILR